MVDGVVESRDEGDRSQPGVAQGDKHHRGAEPDENDSDILDAVIGQQAFEIVLHQRVEHA